MAYTGPSGRMGVPDHPESFARLEADDLVIYVAREIHDSLKPEQFKLLVAVSGYGRYWLHLRPPEPEE